MSHNRAMQAIEHRTVLQSQDHGQHTLDETSSRRAVATEGVLPPQRGQEEDAFRMIVRGPHAPPKRHSNDLLRLGHPSLPRTAEVSGTRGAGSDSLDPDRGGKDLAEHHLLPLLILSYQTG